MTNETMLLTKVWLPTFPLQMYDKSFRLLAIDHLVIETKNVQRYKDFFVNQLGFNADDDDDDRDDFQVSRGRCRFRVRPSGANNNNNNNKSQPDSVTDVCIVVSDVENFVLHVKRACPEALVEDATVVCHPRLGPCKRVRIKSIIGNVYHTILSVESGYHDNDNSVDRGKTEPLISGLDHVALACERGETASIMKWHELIFGMKSFDFGENGDGLLIKTDQIGMKLSALEFWKCSEKGLYQEGEGNFPLFVLVESLPESDGNNQIDVFIAEHGGAGVQHIGIITNDICQSKAEWNSRGVEFIEPPPTYYTEIGKLEDIVRAGEDPTLLQAHGILIDHEEFADEVKGYETGYLMQVFTKPIFDERTFFLELITRRGARGFGAGNITALFRAVQAYMKAP